MTLLTDAMFSPVLKLEDAPKPLSDRWPLRPIQIPVGRRPAMLYRQLPACRSSGKVFRPTPENGPAA
jgi:hypothetical protein